MSAAPARAGISLALGLFALGLAAKPMLVTLPFVLLLLDWWPLGRALRTGAVRRGAAFAGTRSWRGLLAEKAPFLALSLPRASSPCGHRRSTSSRSSRPISGRGSPTRPPPTSATWSLFWPDRLAFLYPYPRAGISGLAAAAAADGSSSSAPRRCSRPAPPLPPVGWLWYLGTLVPVIGLIQVGGQARSDRYTYLTLVGIALALIWLAGGRGRGAGGAPPWRRFPVALAALAVSSAGMCGSGTTASPCSSTRWG